MILTRSTVRIYSFEYLAVLHTPESKGIGTWHLVFYMPPTQNENEMF